MSANIAIVTTSGKAYYRLVSEFRRRRLPFLSLVPTEVIPLYVRVAITTKAEKDYIHCSKILIYDESQDPSKVVDKAVQILRGKKRYRKIIIGVDPGKKCGLAVLGDGTILETVELTSVEETAKEIIRVLEKIKAEKKAVRIGNGAKEYQLRLFELLDEELPLKVDIESVKEGGTTKNIEKHFGHKRYLTDALSAVKISMRNGYRITRKKRNGKDS